MLILKSQEKTAIWLNHKNLIDETYKISCLQGDSDWYSIKSMLFDFQLQRKHTESINNFKKSPKKRKRNQIQTTNSINNEHFLLKSTIKCFLYQIKQKVNIQNSKASSIEKLEEVWRELQCFPQMKGANNTLAFCLFSYNNHQYIIPPQSRFFNHDVTNLNDILPHLETYDFIVLDPPWRNKYIRRIKRAKTCLGYKMMENITIREIPLRRLIHENSLVVIWCTNSEQHKLFLTEDLLLAWNLKLLQPLLWIKTNTSYELIGELREDGKKPYEMLYVACHKDSQRDFSGIQLNNFLISIPSVIHSHKPPLFKVFKEFLPNNSRCLELFARYLQPQFTSIGLEVLKLMDIRLYDIEKQMK